MPLAALALTSLLGIYGWSLGGLTLSGPRALVFDFTRPQPTFKPGNISACHIDGYRAKDEGECLDEFSHPFSGCLSAAYEAEVMLSVQRAERINRLRCGFMDRKSTAWLKALHARFKQCKYVLFTVAFSYGPVQPTDRVVGLQSGVCFVAILDKTTFSALQNETGRAAPEEDRRFARWRWVVTNPALFATTTARSSHLLKALAPRLFPSAEVSIYADIKVPLPRNPISLVRTVQRQHNASPVAIVTVKHAVEDRSVFTEFTETLHHLANRRFKHVPSSGPLTIQEAAYQSGIRGRDFTDIFRLYAHFRDVGFPMFATGMLDSCLLVWNHQNTCTAALACLWHNEIAYYSMREQLSFHFVAQSLGLMHQVFHTDLTGENLTSGTFPSVGKLEHDAAFGSL